MQHVAQLLPLPIRLCRHAAGNDLLAVIVADLGKHHLKPSNSITSDRPHMGRHRWRARWPAPPPVRRFGSPPPAAPGERHPHSSPADGLQRGYFIERQEQQCPSPPVRKQRPHLRNDAFVLGRAPVRHSLGDRIERMPPGHRTSAGQKSRRDRSEQPTMRAGPPLAAIVLRLRLNKVVSQSRERPCQTWGRYGQRAPAPLLCPVASRR
jgi:hypothetical protein